MAARDWRRLAIALLCGAAGVAGGVWVQARFWPTPVPRGGVADTSPGPAGTPLAPSTIDWASPPLPPESRVVFPLVRQSPEGVRAQYMCETSLAPAAVGEFYKSQLARDGWSLYNGPNMAVAPEAFGKNARGGRLAASLLFRRDGPAGRQSCWLTVFDAQAGRTAFRISVLPCGR